LLAPLVLAPSRRILSLVLPLAILACTTDKLTGPPRADSRLGITGPPPHEDFRYPSAALNGSIAYSRNGAIWVIDPDGTGNVPLTGPAEAYNPAWSPDGSKIAFQADSTCCYQIYVMGADGTGRTRLTHGFNQDLLPDWSPDGTKLVFSRAFRDDAQIFVMGADGSNETNVTNHPSSNFHPSWSPDGTKIAFSSDRDGVVVFGVPAGQIYVMNADGTGQSRMTNASANENAPAWSPDGTRIVFESTLEDPVNGNPDIYVMNADGSGRTRLTTNPGFDSDPSWSPDGTMIAYSQDGQIWIMNVDGTGKTRVTPNDGVPSMHPDWGPVAGPPPPQCADGLDNDGDGLIDHPADPGCTSAGDDTESPNPAVSECSDGLDNDGDGKVDFPTDPGCSSGADDSESNPPLPECSDGLDNDGNGSIDFPDDPGCENRDDPTESHEEEPPACRDGLDNDGDGVTDFPDDSDCRSANDDTEGDPAAPDVSACGELIRAAYTWFWTHRFLFSGPVNRQILADALDAIARSGVCGPPE